MFPYQITFLDFPKSEFIESAIVKRMQKLETFFHPIIRCHVNVSCPHRHSLSSRIYFIEVIVSIPGEDAIVAHSSPKIRPQQGIYVSIRDSFSKIERILKKRTGQLQKNKTSQAKPLSHFPFKNSSNESDLIENKNLPGRSLVPDEFQTEESV